MSLPVKSGIQPADPVVRMIVQGPVGVGKTTFAKTFAKFVMQHTGKKCILNDFDPGFAEHAPSAPEIDYIDEYNRLDINPWEPRGFTEFAKRNGELDSQLNNPKYGGIIIDTFDKMQDRCMNWVLVKTGQATEKLETKADFADYKAVKFWSLSVIQRIVASGKHVLVLVHDADKIRDVRVPSEGGRVTTIKETVGVIPAGVGAAREEMLADFGIYCGVKRVWNSATKRDDTVLDFKQDSLHKFKSRWNLFRDQEPADFQLMWPKILAWHRAEAAKAASALAATAQAAPGSAPSAPAAAVPASHSK